MKIVLANWKMNPGTEEEAIKLAKASNREGLVLFPPFAFLEKVMDAINESRLGAQNLALEKGTGPYTGEVSARELKSVGVEYVIVGHSERRAMGESNEIVNKKLKAAVQAGLIPILCVGENEEQRKEGEQRKFLKEQIVSALEGVSEPSRIYFAYEPLWAIGGGKADKPADAVEAIKHIKKAVKDFNKEIMEHAHFVYGGSVDGKNSKKFLEEKDIEGVLVGSASLEPEDLSLIVENAY